MSNYALKFAKDNRSVSDPTANDVHLSGVTIYGIKGIKEASE